MFLYILRVSYFVEKPHTKKLGPITLPSNGNTSERANRRNSLGNEKRPSRPETALVTAPPEFGRGRNRGNYLIMRSWQKWKSAEELGRAAGAQGAQPFKYSPIHGLLQGHFQVNSGIPHADAGEIQLTLMADPAVGFARRKLDYSGKKAPDRRFPARIIFL